ncbi:MAG: TonB family protein [Proteobacteria bacterium]|nr:TonB family protein [Pseudomonadota bacterium]
MNRDIILGVIISLLFHGTILWVSSPIRPDSTDPGSLRRPLDLSIIKTTYREDSRRRAPSPTTSPNLRPVLAEMKQMTAGPVLKERFERSPLAAKADKLIEKKSFPEAIPSPRPIRNTKAILEETNFTTQSPENHKVPVVKPSQSLTSVSQIPSPIVRPVVQKNKPPPVGKYLIEPAEAFHLEKKNSETPRQASTDRGAPRIIQAVPDYAVNPKPRYPRMAVSRSQEGTVILWVEVLPDGSVGEVEIFKSSGHTILDRSALRAVRKWQFKPGTKMGRPIAMKVKVPVVFRLERKSSG